MGILSAIFSGVGIRAILESILYTLPAVLIALTFHEFAHAYVAYKNGDPTARNLGRMTLNPLAHLDVWGFVCMLLVGFGWAKPVPVNPNNYRNYKKGELTVSLAGVTMNLIIGIIGALASAITRYVATNNGYYYYDIVNGIGVAGKIYYVFLNLCCINCALMVFNLIPIYPLDGYHVFEVLLGRVISPRVFEFLRKYGQMILLIVIFVGNRSGFSLVGYLTQYVAKGLLYASDWLVSLFV